MKYLTIIIFFLSLVSCECGNYISSSDGDYCVEAIPKAEFANDILDREIKHYLDQQLPGKDTLYWNLSIIPHNLFIDGEKEYKCSLYRQSKYVPDAGCAYIEYNNEIIVVAGKLNKSFIKLVPNEKRKLLVLYNRPSNDCQEPYTYMAIILSEKRIDSMQSVCDNTIDRHK